MLRAIIVDDVDAIRIKNKSIITQYCSDVHIIAEANSVASAIESIKTYLPDLVFLDMELGDGLGFDVLLQLQPINFKVIFITAFQEFAVKAFRFSAIDYLLKPIDPDELIEAVKKANEAIEKENINLKINALFSNIKQENSLKKLVLKTTERLYSININDIVRCESYKNYTQFYLTDGNKLIVSNTLKEYDGMLTPLNFFRTHQSHLINLFFFDYYSKADGGYIVMKDKSQVPLAVRKKEEFFQLIEQH